MKHIVILMILFSIIACQKKTEPIKTTFNDGIFIHLTKGPNNPDIVLTALDLAVSNSEKSNIIIFLDADGVKSFFKDSPDMNYPFFHNSHRMIGELISKKNVRMLASGPSIRSAGKYPVDLMKGIIPVDTKEITEIKKGKFFSISY